MTVLKCEIPSLLFFRKEDFKLKRSVIESLKDHFSPFQEESTRNVCFNYLHTFPLCGGYKFVTWFRKTQAVYPD
jgi:hypothetical protein